MTVPSPHFLLYAEAALAADCDDSAATRWRFVLRTLDGGTAAEAADEEPAAGRERLELLAVIRGLEALDQPSRVTLMTGSRSLQCGLESGLSQWRENGWHWERYGRMTPVKNADLWQRLDRLTNIHHVNCPKPRGGPSDDLMPPAVLHRPDGRKLRVDQPHSRRGKYEARSAQPATNANAFCPDEGRGAARQVSAWLAAWFGKACRALGAWLRERPMAHTRFNRKSVHSRGVSRAHDRLARRHERPARRQLGPPPGGVRPADDSARRP